MSSYKDILLLGDARLYETCEAVSYSEKVELGDWINQMHGAILSIRENFGFGRAIAAPQLGIMKRLIYMFIDGEKKVFVNPVISHMSEETFTLWDDCMSFPNLLVHVKRHTSITVEYLNENFEPQVERFENDMSELFQHEYDHLNGILCTMRAIDDKSFKFRYF